MQSIASQGLVQACLSLAFFKTEIEPQAIYGRDVYLLSNRKYELFICKSYLLAVIDVENGRLIEQLDSILKAHKFNSEQKRELNLKLKRFIAEHAEYEVLSSWHE